MSQGYLDAVVEWMIQNCTTFAGLVEFVEDWDDGVKFIMWTILGCINLSLTIYVFLGTCSLFKDKTSKIHSV